MRKSTDGEMPTLLSHKQQGWGKHQNDGGGEHQVKCKSGCCGKSDEGMVLCFQQDRPHSRMVITDIITTRLTASDPCHIVDS
ncbi:MAG: hypothetical protein ACPGLY_18790 [Rubripirellula sp.]